ncbi:MAG TPA: EAL domain-containing protein [Thermoanaerobaculia bacterium]|nr:EAL domain-containing protein [Thermoanaerobaculia bacterium]
MALVLYGFYRQYRKSYLLHWTLGWSALAVFTLFSDISAGLTLKLQMAASHPLRIVVAIVIGVTGYLQIGWLLFGVYELVRRRPVRLVESRRMLIALAVFGFIVSLLFISPEIISSSRYFVRVALRALTAAIGFGFAAVVLWRARRRRVGIGFTVLGAAFALYALEQLHYAELAAIWLFSGYRLDYSEVLGYVDFLLLTLMAVGMIACLLEDEREAAELAAVEIEHLAYHDALTGLPNRPLFMDRLIVALAQNARAHQKLAVFFLDLDRFKDINDSLGHTTGDTLLKAVAERVRRCVREGDTVARFGGDEFTLMIPKIENIEDAAKIAQKIIDTLKIPFLVNDRELFVTTSIGVSISPSDGTDPETLVRNADTAMYRAKDQGRDNYQLYAPAMNARALERLALENLLRKAVSQNELVLFYQPQIDANTRGIVGVEALIRWNHPELGLLSPAIFIGVAESSGLIVPIGEWILRTACRQIKVWQRKIDHDIIVAVNLSARQFQQPDLVDMIRSAIDEAGIKPSSLEVEITESNAMQNAENTMYILRELKTLGVRISMDDFGTGYSSLNYLKRFPIDTLKLDKSFVKDVNTDPSDAAIVSAVIQMAHSLNIKVVAEGVEREEQLNFLVRQSCDTIQGYFFSKPLPIDQLEAFVLERKAAMA